MNNQTLLITYDLRKPDRNYSSLYEAIKQASIWAHLVESVWLIRTGQDVAYWRDKLKQHLDSNDGLVVVSVAHSWATAGIDTRVTDWMRQNI